MKLFSFFKKHWIKIKQLYRWYTLDTWSDVIPIEETAIESSVSTPSGTTTCIYLDGEKMSSLESLHYTATAKHAPATVHLVQYILLDSETVMLKPGMSFQKLTIETSELDSPTVLAEFSHLSVSSVSAGIHVNNLVMTQQVTLEGRYEG